MVTFMVSKIDSCGTGLLELGIRFTATAQLTRRPVRVMIGKSEFRKEQTILAKDRRALLRARHNRKNHLRKCETRYGIASAFRVLAIRAFSWLDNLIEK
jgi:hypothetical protein